MAKLVNYKGLSYNDVGIISSIGKIDSRNQIPIEGFRIVVAGMSSILCKEFIQAWIELPKIMRPTIHLVRDKYSLEHLKLIAEAGLQDWVFVGIGIKDTQQNKEIEDLAFQLGYKKLLIDVAFGSQKQMIPVVTRLRAKFGSDALLITGSVQTEEQTHFLRSLGVNIIRTGMATGYVCSTKIKAGVYIGAISEIFNVYNYLEEELTPEEDTVGILADGGFEYPADFGKAFLAGATYCMSGNVFTKCKEARLNIDGSGEYFGMSSPTKGLNQTRGKAFDESFTKKIENGGDRTLQELIEQLWGGIRSTVSYTGCTTLTESIGKGIFCELKTPIPRNLPW